MYLKIASGCASHLFNNQVVAEDVTLSFAQKEKIDVNLKTLQKDTQRLHFSIKKLNDVQISRFEILIPSGKAVVVKVGEFFRITRSSDEIQHVKNFSGLKPSHKSVPQSKNKTSDTTTKNNLHGLNSVFIKVLKKTPFLFKGLKKIQNRFYPEPKVELSYAGGLSFRIILNDQKKYVLESYDNGGVFDEFVNAEGISYPAQVPGNYYCDAYSVIVFLKMYDTTGEEKWLDAAKRSYKFLARIYPQYQPASIVWHHSDFKNAAILELLLTGAGNKINFTWASECLYEDRYEPTNVFALRYHWKSALAKLSGSTKHGEDASRDLEILEKDQTQQGLFHDNITTYPDAHDLTYHQYSTACLGMGALISNDSKAWQLFNKAVNFTLNFTGPDGEPAYTGRASNNIHQSASAILAFHIAAQHPENKSKKGAFVKAAFRIAERMHQFQLENGMLPTCLNKFVDKRVAWNHCETPYNALVAYMLLRSMEISDSCSEFSNIPLEQNNEFVANDSGFASISNKHAYAVVFGGCDRSYGWSENRHVTGCAGIALFGFQKHSSLTPCLDFKVPEKIVISDLPVINGEAAFGRGQLTKLQKSMVCYEHEYGNAKLRRYYKLIDDVLLLISHIIPLNHSVKVEGTLAWPVLVAHNHKVKKVGSDSLVIKNGQEELHLKFKTLLGSSNENFEISDEVTNAKGKARRINISNQLIYSQNLSVLVVSPVQIEGEIEDFFREFEVTEIIGSLTII